MHKKVVAAKKTKVEVITRPTMITSPTSQLTAGGQQHVQLPANIITKIVTNNNATIAAQQNQQKFFTPTSIATPVSAITSVDYPNNLLLTFWEFLYNYSMDSIVDQYFKILVILALWKYSHQ